MKDRTLFMGFMVVLLAVVAAFAVPWAVQQNRVNQSILARLEKVDAALAKSESLRHWARVRIKCVREGPDHAPVAGTTVQLIESHYRGGLVEEPLEKVTDVNGMADFGPVTPGHYLISIKTGILQTTRKVRFSPSQEFEQTISIPRERPPETAIRFHLPEEAGLRGSLVQCAFLRQSPALKLQDGEWKTKEYFSIILLPDGTIAAGARQVEGSGFGDLEYPAASELESAHGSAHGKPVRWPTGTYEFVSMWMYKPVEQRPGSAGGRHWRAVKFAPASGMGGMGGYGGSEPVPPLGVYKAEAGRENVWNLPIPKELLASDESTAATQPG